MRLAVITSHPIQYYAPWFRHIAQDGRAEAKIFYLLDSGVEKFVDPGFQREVSWDIPLLDGYEHEFVPNTSRDPGTHHFWGLDNPSLPGRVREFRPDATLLIGYNYRSMMRLLCSRKIGRTLFRGDSHRLAGEARGPAEFMKHQLRRWVFSKFDAFLPVGKANSDYFLSHGVPPQRLFLAPHCVDNARFSEQATSNARNAWRRQQNIPEDWRVVLFAGKFERKKRPDDLLKAFLEAAPEKSMLVFTGNGELEQVLRDRAAAFPDRIRFAPFQNQSLMPSVYAAADVLVLPSIGNWETWGLAVNEAMACGVPAIVSSHVGCGPDLVHPGRTGWTFPVGNIAALRNCILEACGDDKARARMGAEAKALVLSEYNYERATTALIRAASGASE
jgi:glycosyltransferase involved in cell wall biosynthesis